MKIWAFMRLHLTPLGNSYSRTKDTNSVTVIVKQRWGEQNREIELIFRHLRGCQRREGKKTTLIWVLLSLVISSIPLPRKYLLSSDCVPHPPLRYPKSTESNPSKISAFSGVLFVLSFYGAAVHWEQVIREQNKSQSSVCLFLLLIPSSDEDLNHHQQPQERLWLEKC